MQVRYFIDSIANLPSDFRSRNPEVRLDASWQVHTFIEEMKASVVRAVSVDEVLDGTAGMPFMSSVAWHVTQLEFLTSDTPILTYRRVLTDIKG